MDNTYDILNQILGVVSRIESNSKKDSKVDSSKSKNDSTKGDSQKLFSGSKNPLNFDFNLRKEVYCVGRQTFYRSYYSLHYGYFCFLPFWSYIA